MELTETIDSLNSQLEDLFGIDTITGMPIWRISWSEDQFEKRLGTYDDFSPSGIYIRTVREVRNVPKYRQWIKERYVLERLVLVPEISQDELPTSKLSYEPIYVFETSKGEYLPPKFNAAKFAIDSVYAVQGKSSLAKYIDNETEGMEQKEQRINALQEELFGNETPVGDALAHGYGVTVPNSYGES